MAEKKKKSKNGFWVQVFLMIVFLAGLLIMLYPFYVESINNFIDNRRIEEAQKLDAKRNAKELAKLRAENERAAKKAAKDPFRGTGNMNAKKLRKHLLGRVVIPKINVNVPLFNLTTADTLNYGAAVLQGSSFPTGGKGKRTVIAAHRGLPERKLFTDLDKVKKGDLFVISVYGKNMAYKVYNIKVIKPNKVKSLLPVKDKDLATLMTCTPYMINSHRMLVTGYRVPYTKKIAREVEGASLMNNLIQAAVMLCCVMAIFSVFYILYRIIHGGLLKKREINLDFIVVDADGKPVVGEAFQLFAKNGRRKLYRNQKEFIVKSDEQGRVRFTNLPGNVYCIKNDHLSVRAGVKKLRQENAALYPKKKQKSFIAQDNEEIWIVKNHH